VAAQVVHDDHVAGLQGRHEDLLDISAKADAVDWAVDDARRREPVTAQRRQKGQSLPLSERRFGKKAFAFGAAAMRARHVGLGPRLIEEDETRRIELSLMSLPAFTPPGDVRTILFGCVQAFF